MALALALDPAAGANTSRTRTFCRFDALTSFGTLCVFVCGSRFQCSAGCNESSRVCSKSWTNSRDSRESFCDSWKLWNYKEVNTVMRHYVWDSRVEESVSQHTLAAINCSRDNLVLWDIFETPTQSPNWFLTLSNKVSNVSFFFFQFSESSNFSRIRWPRFRGNRRIAVACCFERNARFLFIRRRTRIPRHDATWQRWLKIE